jgi:hypothetical protein
MADTDKPASPAEQSYVLVARDYADIAHLENPSVIERILSASRTEKIAYVSALLTSGLSKYALAGPKVAFAAMAVEALTDFGQEVSRWIREGKIPEDFTGRPSGYQTWVELLQEIDSNPTDADRLKAMKAMFLAANQVNVTDGDSIAAYHLFQIAKRLNSGELLLLKAIYEDYKSNSFDRTGGTRLGAWANRMAGRVGHRLQSLVLREEPALVAQSLIHPRFRSVPGQIDFQGRANEIEIAVHEGETGRLTDLGIRFCENLETYRIEAESTKNG